ncbi:MAG: anti-phage defense ZorAB system protein ZorA [Xanthomonadales bacterium]|jgi:hypothetical protein|nr:anti-phage defense ZorAB system protein ZorA [Xanthomonadales bacterium]
MDLSELMQGISGLKFGVLIALAMLFGYFFLRFLVPGLWMWRRLRVILKALRKLRADNLVDIKNLFQSDAALLHLWNEFHDTLHRQINRRNGEFADVIYRATVPADVFFNGQNVIDGRLRSEFFKHLPGILTGLGIIGTFVGLIDGLQSFRVPDDPAAVRDSLERLLIGVRVAFVISAAAIVLAMAVTFMEKQLLAKLYWHVDAIAQHLDGLFAMGAGEEYLARLVSASEDSAAQAKILKDALVGDLKLMLQEMTECQIAAQHESTRALAQTIREGITAGLEEPLTRISNVVERASSDQSDIASQLLIDVMSSFSQRLNELLGGQISGMQDLMQKSSQEMQQVVSALHGLVGRMEDSSRRSGDEMAKRMADVIDKMEQRQAVINAQSLSSLDAMREVTSKSQEEVLAKLGAAIGALTQRMGGLVVSLQAETRSVLEEQRKRESLQAEGTREMVNEISRSTVAAIASIGESIAQMKAAATDSGAEMANRMAAAIEIMVQQQAAVNAQSQSSVAAMRDVTAKSQTQVLAKLQQSIGDLSQQMGGLVESLRSETKSLLQEQREREKVQAAGTREMVQEISRSTVAAITSIGEFIAQMKTAATDSGAEMANRMAVAIEFMGQQQAAISAQSQISVAAMREVTAKSQAEILGKLQESIGDLSRQMGGLVGSLRAETKIAIDAQREREKTSAERMQTMVEEMSESASRLLESVSDHIVQMKATITGSGDAMASRMAEAIENMERRQTAINEQSQSFLESMRLIAAKSQTETHEKLQLSINDLSQHMNALMGSLQAETNKSLIQQRKREKEHVDVTRTLVQDISDTTTRVLDSVRDCIAQMNVTIAALGQTTTTAIDKMHLGAGRIEAGATAFSEAGSKVTRAVELTGTAAGKMAEVSGALTSSASALQGALADYRENRQATVTMTAELRAIVEAARREAGLTRQALDSIEASARHLSEARLRANDYLEGVSKVLTENHENFAQGLIKVLDRANQDFHQKLSSAVGLLRGAVQELEVTLSTAPTKR